MYNDSLIAHSPVLSTLFISHLKPIHSFHNHLERVQEDLHSDHTSIRFQNKRLTELSIFKFFLICVANFLVMQEKFIPTEWFPEI